MTPKGEDRAPRAAEARRRLIVRAGLKIAGVAVLDFVLLRILGPDLVDMHKDWALAASLVCLLVAIAATVWLAVQLWSDGLRWRRLDPRANLSVVEWRDR
jgi:hypothetical protein